MTIWLIWIADDMADHTDKTVITFKCDYCKQDRPRKGRKRLTDFDNSVIHFCAACFNNPMARRRMKVIASKQPKLFEDY